MQEHLPRLVSAWAAQHCDRVLRLGSYDSRGTCGILEKRMQRATTPQISMASKYLAVITRLPVPSFALEWNRSNRGVRSLSLLRLMAAAGEIKPYKGTKYKTVDDRYADGWAYNPTTRRWIKVACQQKKAAIEAHPALIVSAYRRQRVWEKLSSCFRDAESIATCYVFVAEENDNGFDGLSGL